MSRAKLVYICSGAVYSIGFFWLWRHAMENKIPDNFMIKGILQDPYKKSYWSTIIAAWDEIEPTIKTVRRFGQKLGILSFTDTLRSQIAESPDDKF